MIDGVVGMGSRELLVPDTELSATILGIAFWVAVGVGGLLLLVVLGSSSSSSRRPSGRAVPGRFGPPRTGCR